MSIVGGRRTKHRAGLRHGFADTTASFTHVLGAGGRFEPLDVQASDGQHSKPDS
jgi:hypothetical protein